MTLTARARASLVVYVAVIVGKLLKKDRSRSSSRLILKLDRIGLDWITWHFADIVQRQLYLFSTGFCFSFSSVLGQTYKCRLILKLDIKRLQVVDRQSNRAVLTWSQHKRLGDVLLPGRLVNRHR